MASFTGSRVLDNVSVLQQHPKIGPEVSYVAEERSNFL
jgi:hypothetical protein